MRSRKRLVQVEMDYVNAHISRTRNAHQCVHVCAIHVNQSTGVMDDTANFLDVFFKESQRVLVG